MTTEHMRITLLQHVAFEGPGAVANWAQVREHELGVRRLDLGELPRQTDDLDALIVMGGPMGVSDDEAHPWLAAEKLFIADVARSGRPVLGICLGAQLIADVMGAPVRRNAHKEIGWHAIAWSEAARALPVFAHMPATSLVFHWHGDTFDLPGGTLALASSAACLRQGFASPDGRLIGLQFHLEMRPEDVRTLAHHGAGDLAGGGTYVQSESALLDSCAEHSAVLKPLLFTLLDRWVASAPTQPGR
jgi:GMP synthase-like glutamine amidotransferase